jgi:hypothetical protein
MPPVKVIVPIARQGLRGQSMMPIVGRQTLAFVNRQCRSDLTNAVECDLRLSMPQPGSGFVGRTSEVSCACFGDPMIRQRPVDGA